MPFKPDLVLTDVDEYVFSKSVTSVPAIATSKAKTSESKPKSVSEPLIEDWISDSEDENETKSKSKQRKPSFAKVEFVKSNEHVKSPRESVKKVDSNKQAKYPRKNSQSPRDNQRNWNNLMTHKLGSNFEFKNKACYVCGSFNHLIKDCDFYEKKIVEKPVWNNARRVNHQNSQRFSHPHPKGNFVPKAVLMKYGLKTLNTARQNSLRAAVSVNTARPINTAYPKLTVNCAKPSSNVFNRAHSHIRRPFNKFITNKNSNLNEKVNTVKRNVTTVGSKAVVSNNKGNETNAVKASTCWKHMPYLNTLKNSRPLHDFKEYAVSTSVCMSYIILWSNIKEKHALANTPLEKKKPRNVGKVFNWETTKYGKIWYDEDVYNLISVETEFPAIVLNDNLTSNETLSSEPTISSLNDNEIDFRISFDESDDEDYTIIYNKNSFSYRIISVNDWKTDSENDNEKVNMPSFLSPEPTVSCLNDLDFFKDFENEFPTIVYNDALTSKSDFSTEPVVIPQHIDEFDLKNDLMKEKLTNIGGEFSNLEDLEVLES
ncbi:ribonuclease H-like domain-containing protein [Tanacetum coccineum]